MSTRFEASSERLWFIARAKPLGCSLAEISELTQAWDGGRCAPVQARLHHSVEAKIADAHRQIAELTTLAADLRRAVRVLSAEPAEGPCDDSCGRVSDTAGADDSGPGSVEVAVPLIHAPPDGLPVLTALFGAAA